MSEKGGARADGGRSQGSIGAESAQRQARAEAEVEKADKSGKKKQRRKTLAAGDPPLDWICAPRLRFRAPRAWLARCVAPGFAHCLEVPVIDRHLLHGSTSGRRPTR